MMRKIKDKVQQISLPKIQHRYQNDCRTGLFIETKDRCILREEPYGARTNNKQYVYSSVTLYIVLLFIITIHNTIKTIDKSSCNLQQKIFSNNYNVNMLGVPPPHS